MDWLSAQKAIPECLRSVAHRARFTYLCGLVHINGVVINGVNSINELRAGAGTPRESIVAIAQEVTCHKTGSEMPPPSESDPRNCRVGGPERAYSTWSNSNSTASSTTLHEHAHVLVK